MRLYCPWWKLKLLQDFFDSPLAADEKYKEMSTELGPFITYIKPLKVQAFVETQFYLNESLSLCFK